MGVKAGFREGTMADLFTGAIVSGRDENQSRPERTGGELETGLRPKKATQLKGRKAGKGGVFGGHTKGAFGINLKNAGRKLLFGKLSSNRMVSPPS